MFTEIFAGFVVLVLYQTLAKKVGWHLPSNGLVIIRDYTILFWKKLGMFVGSLLNLKLWADFIHDHIWTNIRPFFESIIELVKPLWQILFSCGYFFVGFARTHYVIFSNLG